MFEITGASDKIESFIGLMLPLGLVEVSRTGVVAISRGPEGMSVRRSYAAERAGAPVMSGVAPGSRTDR